MRGLLFLVGLSVAAAAAPPPALAQSQRATVAVDARAEVAAALYAASATQAAAERAADARLRAQAAEIARLRSEGRASRTQIAELEERYVADLAQRDRAYAQEIAVFRAAVTDIASTPEGAAALARFNAGDEIGALAVLDQLVNARERARQVRANIETAAERRRVAALALEARARGRIDTAAVIARYAEVTRLDPGVHWDWVELGRLYIDAGNLPEARRAAERAAQTATTDWDRGIALEMEADISIAQGDLRAALRAAEASLEVRRRIASGDDAGAQRNVSVSLNRLGEVLVAQGDLTGARTRYEESLRIFQRLATQDPSSASLQRDVSVGLEKVGDVLVAQGDLTGARARFEQSLAIRQRLAAADPSSASLQADLSVSFTKLGDVAITQGDLSGARRYFEQSLAIDQRLAAQDPSSASLQRDVSVSLEKVGDVLVAQGDLTGARTRFEETLSIRQSLAAQDPSSASLQRDVWASMWRLQRFPESGVTWARIVAAMEDMQRRGVLLPTDTQWLDQARANAARERR